MPCVKRLLLGLAALALLAGCANDPHVAARVGDSSISVDDVDILGQALCIERVSSGQAPATSLASVRGSALAALIESELDASIARERQLPYDARQLGTAMQRLTPLIGQLPAGDRDRATAIITDLLRGQMQLSTAAQEQLQLSGQQPTQQLVTEAIRQIEAQHAKTVKITVNPEFSSPGFGATDDGTESVSRAVSSTARQARSALTSNPTGSYVDDLPAAQKCG